MVTRGGQVRQRKARYDKARRLREQTAKAAAQDAKYFDILKSAGRPDFPDASSGRLGSRGHEPRGTGWGYTTKVVSRSRSGERWGIDSIYYKYQTGVSNVVIGRRSYGPGVAYTKVQWAGEDDWKRKINAAYWNKASLDSKASTAAAAIGIGWNEKIHFKDTGAKRSGRSYGSSWNTLDNSTILDSQGRVSEKGSMLSDTGSGNVVPGTGGGPGGWGFGPDTPLPGEADANIKNYVTSGLYKEEQKAKQTMTDMGLTTGTKPKEWDLTTDTSQMDGWKLGQDWTTYWGKVNESYGADPSSALSSIESNKNYQKQLEGYLKGTKDPERQVHLRAELDKIDTTIKRKEGWTELQIAEEKNKKAVDLKAKKKYLKDTLGEGVSYLNPEQIDPYYDKYKKQEKEVALDVRGMYMQQLQPTSRIAMTDDAKMVIGTSSGTAYEIQQKERLALDAHRQLYQGNAQLIANFDDGKGVTLPRYRAAIRDTQKYIPVMEKELAQRKEELEPYKQQKKESNVQYSSYVQEINRRQTESKSNYASGKVAQSVDSRGRPIAGTHSLESLYDRDFGQKLRTFADKREKLRYDLALAEVRYETYQKDIELTKKQIETMKKMEKESRRKNLSSSSASFDSGRNAAYYARGGSRGNPAGMSGRSRAQRYGSGRGVQKTRTRSGYKRLGGLV